MSTEKKTIGFLVVLIILSSVVACQVMQSPSPDVVETPELTPDSQSLPTEFVVVQGYQIRQWAAEADANLSIR